ncbi:MAG: NAD(P)/FAD-dependent oxidoreductase [Candidatus Iainarchaeum archaeon]|uniref:NAD(P)/FAD-dependent oxidoreductase n=1 Tax=Candidatus Iainarchaeum sp. TaxID=3101447 RepID=A0A7T9DJJ2_9ARCH|nr:MAG: NAD(P)/FAD-dependent oxidoreductase [Candidatus Diapherotrites archaeon]
MLEKEYDVIIIGAGVAGCVAALKLVANGKRVLLVEKLKKIGSHNSRKLDVTESQGIADITAELNLPFNGKFNRSIWYSPNANFELDSRVYDYYVLRGSDVDSFESIVSNRIKSFGGTVLTNAEITNYNFENEYVKSVVINYNNRHQVVNCKYLFFADGHHSKSLEIFGIKERPGPTFIGYGEICVNSELKAGVTHVFFDSKLAPGGYFYLGKADNGEVLSSIVINKALQGNISIKTYYQNFIAANANILKLLGKYKVKNSFVGMGKTGIISRRSLRNMALLGDAGRTMDPIFGYGVRQAIISGYMAAVSAIDCLNNKKRDLDEYEDKLNKSVFQGRETENQKFRNFIDHLNNEELDYAFKSIETIGLSTSLDDFFDNPFNNIGMLLNVTLKKPKLLTTVIIKFFLA